MPSRRHLEPLEVDVREGAERRGDRRHRRPRQQDAVAAVRRRRRVLRRRRRPFADGRHRLRPAPSRIRRRHHGAMDRPQRGRPAHRLGPRLLGGHEAPFQRRLPPELPERRIPRHDRRRLRHQLPRLAQSKRSTTRPTSSASTRTSSRRLSRNGRRARYPPASASTRAPGDAAAAVRSLAVDRRAVGRSDVLDLQGVVPADAQSRVHPETDGFSNATSHWSESRPIRTLCSRFASSSISRPKPNLRPLSSVP